jgi:hypothetical protein
MTMQLKILNTPAEAESRLLAEWLLRSQFEPPPFAWVGLAVRIVTDGPQTGYGKSGFFYEVRGDWYSARFAPDADRAQAGESEIYDRWISATAHAFGRPWIWCRFQVVRGETGLIARFEYEFRDWERWEYQGGRELGDMLRPPELPTPPPRRY